MKPGYATPWGASKVERMLNQLEARLKHHIDAAVHGAASSHAKMASDTRRGHSNLVLLQSKVGTNICTPVITHGPRCTSFIRSFVQALIHWFVDSLNYWFTWFIGSLIHWLFQWFSDSSVGLLICWFIVSWLGTRCGTPSKASLWNAVSCVALERAWSSWSLSPSKAIYISSSASASSSSSLSSSSAAWSSSAASSSASSCFLLFCHEHN